MDEFEMMVSVILACVAIICCFAVVGIAFAFLRFLG